jgi:hypothetical protein
MLCKSDETHALQHLCKFYIPFGLDNVALIKKAA